MRGFARAPGRPLAWIVRPHGRFRNTRSRSQDAAASVALRKAIFGETDFLLYAPDEYLTTPDEFSAQLERITASGHSRSLLAESMECQLGYSVLSVPPFPDFGTRPMSTLASCEATGAAASGAHCWRKSWHGHRAPKYRDFNYS